MASLIFRLAEDEFMISSMTGYGDAQGALEGIEFTLEVRCLNNRYYKPSIRLGEDFTYLEPTVDVLLRKAVLRGSLICTLRVRTAPDHEKIEHAKVVWSHARPDGYVLGLEFIAAPSA